VLDLGSGESRRMAFRVRVRTAGSARVRMDVRLGTAHDAIEVRLPVVEPSVPRTAATAVHLVPAVGDGTAGNNGLARATETVAPLDWTRGGADTAKATSARTGSRVTRIIRDEVSGHRAVLNNR